MKYQPILTVVNKSEYSATPLFLTQPSPPSGGPRVINTLVLSGIKSDFLF